MSTLATRLKTPLQADELLTNPRTVYEIARAQGAHVLHFKIHKYGGLLQAKRMAAVAEAAGLEISIAPYFDICLLYTSPSPRDGLLSRMPSSA